MKKQTLLLTAVIFICATSVCFGDQNLNALQTIEPPIVDGNDIDAVSHWVERALDRGRRGEGPTLIEAVTYRLSDHTTADDSSRYRKKDEVEVAWKVEPLIRIRNYLVDLGVWDDDKEKALLEESAAKVDEAVQTYLNTAKAPVESMFDYMYEELPEFLEEQRDHAMQYGDTNGGDHG